MAPLPPRRPYLPALLVRGVLERAEGLVDLRADRLDPVTVPARTTSRDFR